MKQFFGWVFLILGIGNILMAVLMLSQGFEPGPTQGPAAKFTFGIGFIILGYWMVSGSKKKDNDNNSPSKFR